MRLLLTTPYDLAVPGGVNRHARELLAAMVRQGMDAQLIGPSSKPETEADSRVTVMGSISTHAFNGAITRTTIDPRVVGQLRKLMQAFRPNIVHAQEPIAPLPGAAALWLAPRDALRVGTFHTYSETSRGYLWAWPWCRAVWSRLHLRIAVSEAAREFATRYHRAEFAILPNGVRKISAEERRSPRPPDRPVRVLFVGRMDEVRKGFGVLLEALRRTEMQQPGNLALEAIGRGATAWREAAAGLPVSFLGEVSDAELAVAYGRADVMCVPSLGGESFGLVALEALVRGVPVVASQIRGYAEWLDGSGTGALVKPNDPAALASALLELVRNPERHAACASRALAVAERYAWDAIATRTRELYESTRSKELGRG